MSTIVKDITEAFESSVATTLPTYTELDFKFDVTKNNYYNNLQRFGVIPGAGFNTPTTTKATTISQSFNLILTTEYVNQNDTDSAQREAVFEVHDALNEVYQDVVPSKLGLPMSILNIEITSIDAPLFDDEAKVVILNSDFTIQYRTAF